MATGNSYRSRYNIPFQIEIGGVPLKKQAGPSEDYRDFFESDTAPADADIVEIAKQLLGSVGELASNLYDKASKFWKKHPKLNSLPWGKIIFLLLLSYILLGKANRNSNNDPQKGAETAVLVGDQDPSDNNSVAPADGTKLPPPNVVAFINRFEKIAKDEMKIYGIPASIKMGQAIIESQAGKSVLAKGSNNYFGLKCKPKCLGCTCRNYEDDNKYDMFRVFDTAWESWREHSKLLCNPRYSKLPLYGKDYKKWAKGLKAAGYATDPKYAEKLITVIEKYNLTKLDI